VVRQIKRKIMHNKKDVFPKHNKIILEYNFFLCMFCILQIYTRSGAFIYTELDVWKILKACLGMNFFFLTISRFWRTDILFSCTLSL